MKKIKKEEKLQGGKQDHESRRGAQKACPDGTISRKGLIRAIGHEGSQRREKKKGGNL